MTRKKKTKRGVFGVSDFRSRMTDVNRAEHSLTLLLSCWGACWDVVAAVPAVDEPPLVLLLLELPEDDDRFDVVVPPGNEDFVPDKDDICGLLPLVDDVSGNGITAALLVSAPVLSGAFGWPPSSGDGAILDNVKRRKIISGETEFLFLTYRL